MNRTYVYDIYDKIGDMIFKCPQRSLRQVTVPQLRIELHSLFCENKNFNIMPGKNEQNEIKRFSGKMLLIFQEKKLVLIQN